MTRPLTPLFIPLLVTALTSLAQEPLRPLSLASFDADRDGAPDLVAGYADGSRGLLTVRRGDRRAFAPGDDAGYQAIQNGDRPPTFLPGVDTYSVPEPPSAMTTGDFDGDGNPDLLVSARDGRAYLLAGDGNGRLGAAREIPLPSQVGDSLVASARITDLADLLADGRVLDPEAERMGDFVAALALPPRVNGERDVIVLRSGEPAPAEIVARPLATLQVDRTDDTAAATACTAAPNDCSLRGAILAANAMTGPHTIFLPAGTYDLTLNGSDDAGLVGDLDVRTSFTSIQGAGAGSTTIQRASGQPSDRILHVNPAGTNNFSFTISGVTIRGGRGQSGGGIEVLYATADVIDCTITQCSGPTGGGINFIGVGNALNVIGTTVSSCFASGGDGGGGIMFSGLGGDRLDMTRCVIENNRAVTVAGKGGGGLFVAGGAATVTRSQFTFNTASLDADGGSILVGVGSLNASFNRFVDNNPSLTIYPSASSTLNDNWWGQNTGPGAGVLGAFPATWLQLRHTAGTGTLLGGASTTLTADLYGRNAGGPIAPASLAGLPPFGAPPSASAIFTNAAGGTLSAISPQYVNGQATATFTAACAAGGSALAFADHQSLAGGMTIQCPNLGLFASFTSATTCGRGASYALSVSNDGTAPAPNSVLTLNLPACLSGVTCTVDQGPGTCTVGPGNVVTATFGTIGVSEIRGIIAGGMIPTAAPGCGPGFTATAVATTTATEPSTADNTLSMPLEIFCADLWMAKSAPTTALAGNTVTYMLTSTNDGPIAAQDVSIVDPLPPGLRLQLAIASAGAILSATPGSGGPVSATWPGATSSGTARTLTIVARVCAETLCGAVLANTATTSSTVSDPSPGNNAASTSTTVQAQSDLSITMSHLPEPVAAGAQTTYTIQVRNNGPSVESAAGVTVTLPAGWTAASATPSQGTCSGMSSGTVTCALGSLSTPDACTAGLPSTASITLVANVPVAADPGVQTTTAQVTSGNCLPDGNTGDNTYVDSTTVTLVSDVALVKLDSIDPVAANQELTYTLNVENKGPSRAFGVTVSDPLPGTAFGLPPVRFKRLRVPAGFTCTSPYPGSTGLVSCSSTGPLMPGTYQIAIVVSPPPVCGRNVTLSNTATVGSTSHDPDPMNNTSSQTTLVVGGPCFNASQASPEELR